MYTYECPERREKNEYTQMELCYPREQNWNQRGLGGGSSEKVHNVLWESPSTLGHVCTWGGVVGWGHTALASPVKGNLKSQFPETAKIECK